MGRLIDEERPTTLREIAGHEGAKREVRRMTSRPGWDRGAFIITGPTGVGKTTMARAIVRDVCGVSQFDVHEKNGASCSVEAVREIAEDIHYSTIFGNGWKAYIVNECQSLWPWQVQVFLSILDDLPARRLFIFTTTREDKDKAGWLFTGEACGEFEEAFAGRCTTLELKADKGTMRKMAERARTIARKHGLDGQPVARYLEILEEKNGSMRALLQTVESGRMKSVKRVK